MRTVSYLFTFITLLASCSGSCEPYSHEAARRAAQDYYTCLISGDYGRFADGMLTQDSMPAGMRSQLTDMCAQFMHGQSAANAIVRAEAVSDSLYADSTADVFLDLVFADSTRERVCLPMTLYDGTWRIR